ncbi:site-specific DNA-methyltransferase [Paraclostridium bifermentans]|uniref:DNA-methyltransferase n=1 Tax=Paraclostridium bifermentans TaxID=1490 RepID=UPI001C124BC0|nr:site-specific DNA-methyltransferase [Paraclostridium bifermentans]MBU5289978.1 site-specific DNA-methyltransferase [Paraclostridium bifermentans]
MYKIKNYDLYNADCLEVMKSLKDNSIDLILCDPPFGTTNCEWDSIIPFKDLWNQYNRILKPNGAVVLFSAQPFTTHLINSNIKNYKYSWYWIKNTCTGFAFAKHQPMRKVEDINVFYKKKPLYVPQGLVKLEKPKVKKRKTKISNNDSIYNDSSLANKQYVTSFTNYPNNVLFFNKEPKSLHPTQKPVDLLEYLIKTYTNKGDIVLDNCMGSGSCGVATINLKRRFIGIEKDKNYFKIAKTRIELSILGG